MPLKFCKKCKGLLMPFKDEEAGISRLKCLNCGNIQDEDFSDSINSNEKLKKPERKGRGVKEDKNEFATYPNVCKKMWLFFCTSS